MSVKAAIDSRSGYRISTKTYHSLRPSSLLPDETLPLSVTSYALSFLPSPPPANPALVDALTGASLSYTHVLSQIQSLSSSLSSQFGLSKGHVTFVLSPTALHVPILYLSLLSIGVIVTPSNPLSSPQEISRQLRISRPTLAFATSQSARKLPPNTPTLILDSPFFLSLLSSFAPTSSIHHPVVHQSDPAAILYSSGTTGAVKGAVLTHRNIIATIATFHDSHATASAVAQEPAVTLFTIPLFHVFGFFMLLRSIVFGDTAVLMERFEFGAMLRAVEDHRVTFMLVSPPLVVAMVKSDDVSRYDLSSLRALGCAGALLGREVAERFTVRFPHVKIIQGYGMTESAGLGAGSGSEEKLVYGAVGRLSAHLEARIVDPSSDKELPPGQQGELWLRGPSIMKGYIGDDEATAFTMDSEGWLKTGDLCYFDHDGFLFIVDRLKELIKYKAYQVPPAELEHLLQSHPGIADAAVIPYPHEEAGQIPMAFVVRQPGSDLTEEQVMDFIAKQVAPYKKIRRVAFISSIPKSVTGKILRRELVSRALSSSTSEL